MTTVIDHAIAIPTRPANVWAILSDISNNPTWHPDSQRVQYLTTMQSGRGMRWRNTTMSNKEQVLEITAWYEGLGYEYRIVDGSSYANNRGRIRLQESPEGTVVQWTFSYDADGFLSNLRNRLSMKGQADKEVIQGLRNIYTLIKETKSDEILDPEQSKAYLKEAPNVEERASYQPRYPSKVTSQEIEPVKITPEPDANERYQPPVADTSSPIPTIEEPPISEEDTRPNPSVQPVEAETLPEPDFLQAVPEHEPFKPPAVEPEPIAEVDAVDVQEANVEPANVVEDSTGETEIQPETQVEEADTPQPEVGDPVAETTPPAPIKQDISKLDTATVSVFDIFGVEKPSQVEEKRITAERAQVIEQPTETKNEQASRKAFLDRTPIIPDIQPEPIARRRGLRAALRASRVAVRLPENE